MQNKTKFEMPSLRLKFTVKMLDSDIIIHEHEEIGHSWTRNAWNAFYAMQMDCGGFGSTFGPGALSMRAYPDGAITATTTTSFSRASQTLAGYGFYNNAANATFGIIVGTGNETFMSEDYALNAVIAHGTSTGQLSYIAQTTPASTYETDSSGDYWYTTHARFFNNNSGGDITVKEAGLVYYGSGVIPTYALMARDVLDTPVTVPNGAQLTIRYIITTGVFTVCESTAVPVVALGTAGMGGYYIGQYIASSLSNSASYFLIASPIGGEITSGKWADPVVSSGATDTEYGYNNTQTLIGLGAGSPLGQAVSAYRTSTSIADWYVPSYQEAIAIAANQASMPAGHEFTNAASWASTRTSTSAYTVNLFTGAISASAQTASNISRLIRRIHASDWVAD